MNLAFNSFKKMHSHLRNNKKQTPQSHIIIFLLIKVMYTYFLIQKYFSSCVWYSINLKKFTSQQQREIYLFSSELKQLPYLRSHDSRCLQLTSTHWKTNKETFRKLTLIWLEIFPYTHERELIKCSDSSSIFGCLLQLCYIWGIFHFVASCAERKLFMASLSNLMRATQKPLASIQGHV